MPAGDESTILAAVLLHAAAFFKKKINGRQMIALYSLTWYAGIT